MLSSSYTSHDHDRLLTVNHLPSDCKIQGVPQIVPFLVASFRDLFSTNADHRNDAFSSQTWAIFVPKMNFEVKSIVWPTSGYLAFKCI